MSDVDRLLAAFDAGEALRPSPLAPNLVDLVRAVVRVAGAPEVEVSEGEDRLARLIGPADHLVFVLADGLGVAQLETLPEGAFLRRHLAMSLLTVFPSTTAVALTTLATGEWPAAHGITGWWTYVSEIDGAATVLPFQRRADERSLLELGIGPEEVFPVPSLMAEITRDRLALLPPAIAGSVFTRYWNGGRAAAGYASLRQAVDVVLARVRDAGAPTFTYLYTPRVDSAAHDYGADSRQTVAEVVALDQQMERLCEVLAGRARVVLTADHGHLDAPVTMRHLIGANEALSEALRIAPAYDARVMCFHLHHGAEQQFRTAFNDRFSDDAYLLSVDEVEELELLGPGPLATITRQRLGDFVGIARGRHAIGFSAATGGREIMSLASHHSGLTPQEMRIPLVIV